MSEHTSKIAATAGTAVLALLMIMFFPLILLVGCQENRDAVRAAIPGDTDFGVSQMAGYGQLDESKIPRPEWVEWVKKAGSICAEVPPVIIAAQIEAESSWNPDAKSSAGAVGLSQFLPSTFAEEGIGVDEDGNGTADPYEAADAIMAQGRYMCRLVQGLEKPVMDGKIPWNEVLLYALAGYNAGLGRVTSGQPLPAETARYVPKIMHLAATKYARPGTADPGAATLPATFGARPGPPETPTGPLPAGHFGDQILAAALRWEGTTYRYGHGGVDGPTGNPAGFDCSSLVQYAVYHASNGHVLLPRVSRDQGNSKNGFVIPIEPGGATVGDLIFFKIGDRNGFTPNAWTHVGIVSAVQLGTPVQIFHASTPQTPIGYADLSTPYWKRLPSQIFRVAGAEQSIADSIWKPGG